MTLDSVNRTGPDRLPHYVSDAPFDPYSVEKMSAGHEKFYMASQWTLMWWKLKKHKLAVISGVFLIFMYLVATFSEFLAPYEKQNKFPVAGKQFIYAPPQPLHIIHDGGLTTPFVYAYKVTRNPVTLKREYVADTAQPLHLRFFCRGDAYEMWDLFSSDLHLFCPAEGGTAFLFGTDQLGRDLLSRIIYGARISLTVGLVGIIISFVLGIVLGGLAGYYGGWIDATVQRVIETIRSFPELPLWMALSAALPVTLSPVVVYLGITVILGLFEWTGLARAVRSKLLALREEDFCVAAQLMGAKPSRIIHRHLLPSFGSHIIASATLAIPSMILGETALSFLGLGLRPPIVSWGVLLNDAQNINAVAVYPWIMMPVIPVFLVVLAFNFFGDGLRDAADPYK